MLYCVINNLQIKLNGYVQLYERLTLNPTAFKYRISAATLNCHVSLYSFKNNPITETRCFTLQSTLYTISSKRGSQSTECIILKPGARQKESSYQSPSVVIPDQKVRYVSLLFYRLNSIIRTVNNREVVTRLWYKLRDHFRTDCS